jgi:hypothetical protein
MLSPCQPPQSIPEKAVSIPVGAVVKVKLQNKSTLQGQLVSVSSSGVTVRVAEPGGGGVQERAVPFGEIRQIAEKKNNQTGLKIMAGVGIALGILFGIGLIFAAAAD